MLHDKAPWDTFPEPRNPKSQGHYTRGVDTSAPRGAHEAQFTQRSSTHVVDTRSDTRYKISGDDLRSAASSRSPSSVWCAGSLRNPTPGRDLSRMARLEIDAHHRLVHSTRLGRSVAPSPSSRPLGSTSSRAKRKQFALLGVSTTSGCKFGARFRVSEPGGWNWE